MARDENIKLEEIYEIKKPLMPVGLFRALRRKTTEIWPIKAHLEDYDKIIIMSPVWGAHPVSAINSVFEILPSGKRVDIIMVSSGGGTQKTKAETMEIINKKKCNVVHYTDMKVSVKDNEVTSTILTSD